MVVRAADGGYSTVPSAEYVGYEVDELEPIDVENVDLTKVMAGAPETPDDGVFRIPRDYR
jgi:hypothetical protein